MSGAYPSIPTLALLMWGFRQHRRPGGSTLNSQFSILNSRLSTLDSRLTTLKAFFQLFFQVALSHVFFIGGEGFGYYGLFVLIGSLGI